MIILCIPYHIIRETDGPMELCSSIDPKVHTVVPTRFLL